MLKNTRLLGALFFAIAVLLLAGCTEKTADTTEQAEREVPVQVDQVSFGSLSGENLLSGTIVPEDQVDVSANLSGEVTKILVDKGDTVERGETIARLDDFDERNAYEQQQASLKQAQASLKQAQNGKTNAENNLRQAKASLKQAEASLAEAKKSRDDNLDNMDFQIKNAEIALTQSQQNFDRMKALYEDGLTSKQNFDDAKTALENAKTALNQAKQQKEQADSDVGLKSLEAAVEQAEVGVDIAKSSINDAEVGVEQAQASVEQAQLGVEQAQERLDDKVIKAPIAGEVTEVNLEVGEMASPQAAFATIVAADEVKASINVLPEQLASFQVGDEVDVKVGNETYTGTISYISAISSGSGLFTVEASLDNEEGAIRPGMIATFVIDEVLASDTILVPSESIVQKEGMDVVFVVKDGAAVQVQVEVVRYGTDRTAVSGELQENDQVVISGQNLLEDGNLVTIMEEE